MNEVPINKLLKLQSMKLFLRLLVNKYEDELDIPFQRQAVAFAGDYNDNKIMSSTLYRPCIVFLLLWLLAQPVAAQVYQEAQTVLSGLLDSVVFEVKNNKPLYVDDNDKLYELIEQRILIAVDVELFSKLVLGKHWQAATEAQRRAFASAFHGMLMRSYGKSLILLSNVEKIDYLRPEKIDDSARYQVVATKIFFSGGQTPVSISYAMLKQEQQWKIFDLIIDGLSLAKQFRQNFNIEIKETSLDALIQRLSTS